MMRFVAGVVSALLLVAAGFFVWRGLARDGTTALPAPPAAIAALVGTSPAAVPDDPPQASEKTKEEKRFARYDHDRDGHIGRDEYLAARRKTFAKLDTDHDGKLSFDEYAAKATAKFVAADADKSGTLDATEFATTRVARKPKPRCAPVAATPPAAKGDEDES